jgi:hypothetical protein
MHKADRFAPEFAWHRAAERKPVRPHAWAGQRPETKPGRYPNAGSARER